MGVWLMLPNRSREPVTQTTPGQGRHLKTWGISTVLVTSFQFVSAGEKKSSHDLVLWFSQTEKWEEYYLLEPLRML